MGLEELIRRELFKGFTKCDVKPHDVNMVVSPVDSFLRYPLTNIRSSIFQIVVERRDFLL